MKIILDCNVLISAGLINGLCRRVLENTIAHHQLLISDAILSEFIRTARRKKFRSHYPVLKDLIEFFL